MLVRYPAVDKVIQFNEPCRYLSISSLAFNYPYLVILVTRKSLPYLSLIENLKSNCFIAPFKKLSSLTPTDKIFYHLTP